MEVKTLKFYLIWFFSKYDNFQRRFIFRCTYCNKYMCHETIFFADDIIHLPQDFRLRTTSVKYTSWENNFLKIKTYGCKISRTFVLLLTSLLYPPLHTSCHFCLASSTILLSPRVSSSFFNCGYSGFIW